MEHTEQPTPVMHKGKWTDEEQVIFIDTIRKHGRNYEIICDKIKTRTKTQIYTHVQSHFTKRESPKKRASKGQDVENAKESGGKRKRKSQIVKQAKKIVMGVNAAEADKGMPSQVSVDSHEAKATPIVANATRVSFESTQPSADVLSAPPPAGLEVEVTKATSSKKIDESAKQVAKAEVVETTNSSKEAEMQVKQPRPVKAFYQDEEVQLLLSALAGAFVVWVVRNLVL
jgi:hypothetical protein